MELAARERRNLPREPIREFPRALERSDPTPAHEIDPLDRCGRLVAEPELGAGRLRKQVEGTVEVTV